MAKAGVCRYGCAVLGKAGKTFRLCGNTAWRMQILLLRVLGPACTAGLSGTYKKYNKNNYYSYFYIFLFFCRV